MKTVESHSRHCSHPHEFAPGECTVVRRGDGFWLLAVCPDGGARLGVRLSEAEFASVVDHPVRLDPEVRDYLKAKGSL